MSEQTASILYLLSKLPGLKSKRTKFSKLSKIYFKYENKLEILGLFLYWLITFICFNKSSNIYFMVLWFIYYLFYLFFIFFCQGILGKEKISRDIPINILKKSANHLKVEIDLKLLKDNINGSNFIDKNELIKWIFKNIKLQNIEILIIYFESKLNNLNQTKRKIDLFGKEVITLIVTLLLGLLDSNLILDFQVLGTPIELIIIIFLPPIIFAYYFTNPSQSQRIYEEFISVLKEARDKKKKKGIFGK